HCGAGTTASGLRAGVPTIPIPFFADQPFWANKMYDLGLSAKPILRKNLSVDSLINSIDYVTKHNFIKENCLHIKEKINQEDGVDLAVKKINKFFRANIKST
ncbi:MAG: glycosyltransferase, partial [Candidatus Sericytochromatia bacterium]|nr:glycosyltransferase [Candidatus Sericytochromatia bacterium]